MKKLLLILSMILGLNTSAVMADLTQNQLHATMGIVTNFILSDGTVQFHGKSYKPVTSPHTGRVWLDRNIGASKKCTSYDYPLCYGDLFQWGRKHDGHESSVDSTTVVASDINNAGAEYIRGNADWASTDLSYGNSRATNWLKTDGSAVCPVGYRVPLRSELDAEVGDISNKETAYANFLKFPAAGYRSYGSANFYDVGTWGTVWSVTCTASRASYFRFSSTSNWNDGGERAWGLSVRCIKHVGKPLIYHNTTTYSAVTSPHTGEVWLDRNLGASQVCTSFNDSNCYGDYYQWGRNFDGHEKSISASTIIQATQIDPVQVGVVGKFIESNSSYDYDWAEAVDASGSIRSANWSKTDGSSVCPVGFRVPNIAELRTETLDATDISGSTKVTNRNTAFTNFLRLPSAGNRRSWNSNIYDVGSWGNVHTISGSYLYTTPTTTAAGYSSWHSRGISVRCLKD